MAKKPTKKLLCPGDDPKTISHKKKLYQTLTDILRRIMLRNFKSIRLEMNKKGRNLSIFLLFQYVLHTSLESLEDFFKVLFRAKNTNSFP